MFKSVIKSTPLISEAANMFYQNITGDSFNCDVSFLTTLRALVYPRMAEGERLELKFSASYFSHGDVSTHSDSVLNIAWNNSAFSKRQTSRIGIVEIQNIVCHSKDDAGAVMQIIARSFEGRYDGWHKMKKVTDFFRKTFGVLCFINMEAKSSFLLVTNLDVRKLHYLQCAIFAFMPWYFDPKVGVSDLEMRLIESLRLKEPDEYLKCIGEIAVQYDFREQNIRSMLSGFENKFERQEYDITRANIGSVDSKIDELNHQIGEYLRKRAELEIRLLGLEAKIQSSDSDSEIMEYFLCNKKLSLEHVDNREMIFTCSDYLTYFNEDMAKQVIDNPKSYIYFPNGTTQHSITQADMKKLMYAIFIDQKLRIKFCAAYNFQLDGSVDALRGYDYSYDFNDCTPNPHIDRYACMGTYRVSVNELLKNRDYIGAIEQCIASCKSLNFGDNMVMSEFMLRLYGEKDVNIRCIELPDKSVVTPTDAIQRLYEQEGSGESNE